uniref:Uncharacterized protein n=1 Tax=Lotus japonicus TaxID=34305 RepID=I3T206_LOTJA|nr:unknown [Lotus japonicus]
MLPAPLVHVCNQHCRIINALHYYLRVLQIRFHRFHSLHSLNPSLHFLSTGFAMHMNSQNNSHNLRLFFLLLWLGLCLFLLDFFLLWRFWNWRKKLNMPVTLPLHSLQNLNRIRFVTFNYHLVRFAIRDYIFNSWESFEGAANLASTTFAMHEHFEHNLWWRRRFSFGFFFLFFFLLLFRLFGLLCFFFLFYFGFLWFLFFLPHWCYSVALKYSEGLCR